MQQIENPDRGCRYRIAPAARPGSLSGARPDVRLRFADTGRALSRSCRKKLSTCSSSTWCCLIPNVAKLKSVISLMHAQNGTRLVLVQ